MKGVFLNIILILATIGFVLWIANTALAAMERRACLTATPAYAAELRCDEVLK